jgi:hypothetical protein
MSMIILDDVLKGCCVMKNKDQSTMRFGMSSAVMILLLTAVSGGCGGSSKPWEVVVPVSGQVTFEGKPVSGAQITLYPTSTEVPDSVRPSATTTEDGSFVLGTFGANDGAPVGDYKASVVWFKVVDVGSGPVRGDNVLPQKYSNPEASGITVTINAPETKVPAIALTKK